MSQKSQSIQGYEGQIKNGKKHGKGKMIYPDFSIYEGDWVNDMKQGVGRLETADTIFIYKGQFLNDVFNGDGIYKYGETTYEGKFLNGVFHGKGKITYPDGKIYQGDWKDGKANGRGTATAVNGDIYVGDWKDSKKHGKGKETSPDGSIYEGDWKKGYKDGKGVFKWDGSIYQGDFRADKFNGKGKATYDGKTYEGDWVDDKKHGKGKLILNDYQTYEGDWVDDKKHGKGKYINTHIDQTYEGDWVEEKRHGKGKTTLTDGSIYEGDFRADKINGKGKLTFDDGSVYDGNWKDNKWHGKGVFILPSGEVYDGIWKDLSVLSSIKDDFINGTHRFLDSKDNNYMIQQKIKNKKVISSKRFKIQKRDISIDEEAAFLNLFEGPPQKPKLKPKSKPLYQKQRLQQILASKFTQDQFKNLILDYLVLNHKKDKSTDQLKQLSSKIMTTKKWKKPKFTEYINGLEAFYQRQLLKAKKEKAKMEGMKDLRDSRVQSLKNQILTNPLIVDMEGPPLLIEYELPIESKGGGETLSYDIIPYIGLIDGKNPFNRRQARIKSNLDQDVPDNIKKKYQRYLHLYEFAKDLYDSAIIEQKLHKRVDPSFISTLHQINTAIQKIQSQQTQQLQSLEQQLQQQQPQEVRQKMLDFVLSILSRSTDTALPKNVTQSQKQTKSRNRTTKTIIEPLLVGIIREVLEKPTPEKSIRFYLMDTMNIIRSVTSKMRASQISYNNISRSVSIFSKNKFTATLREEFDRHVNDIETMTQKPSGSKEKLSEESIFVWTYPVFVEKNDAVPFIRVEKVNPYRYIIYFRIQRDQKTLSFTRKWDDLILLTMNKILLGYLQIGEEIKSKSMDSIIKEIIDSLKAEEGKITITAKKLKQIMTNLKKLMMPILESKDLFRDWDKN